MRVFFQNRDFENNFDFTVMKSRSSHKMESSILWEDRDFITVKSKLVRDFALTSDIQKSSLSSQSQRNNFKYILQARLVCLVYGKIHGFAIIIVFIILKRLVYIFLLLDSDGVSRPSWGARHIHIAFHYEIYCISLLFFNKIYC